MNLRTVLANLIPALLPLALAGQTANWTQQNPTASPSARSTPVMVYDSMHSQVVLFGGQAGSGQQSVQNDTWIWDGANWTLSHPAQAPEVRSNSAMAYDSTHGQAVLFGGAFNSSILGDTWLWDGANWTQSLQAGPSERVNHSMAYDSVHSQVVLFGGQGTSGVPLNDTWVWDGSTWTLQHPRFSPPARSAAAMAFDSGHGQVVLFGGYNGSSALSDTWLWDGTNWNPTSPLTSPPPRLFHVMSYDAPHGQVLLFGGAMTTTNTDLLNDTWVWDGSNWTQKLPQTKPPVRNRFAMAFDAGHGEAVIFGGRDPSSNFLGDTWTWNGGPVTTPPPPPGPTITSIESASGFGGFSSVAPGSWVEIYGSNLAPDTRSWLGADFTGANAPTSLDGVEVLIGGQKAFIDYISSKPGQINAQLPSNIPTGGPLQLTVTNGTATSSAVNVTVNPVEPGLLAPSAFLIGGKQYVVALLPDNGTYILPAGAIPGVASRPAQPGDVLTLYGIGFGAVTPSIPAGQIATVANQLAQPVQILFGQTPAQVTFQGLTQNSVGLYQFDVVVPPVSDNLLTPLTFNLGGVAGTQTLYIAVQKGS